MNTNASSPLFRSRTSHTLNNFYYFVKILWVNKNTILIHRSKDKYIHLSRDVHYQPEKHLLSTTPARAEAACSYDLDATDAAWLKLLNAERARAGAPPVTEDQLEKVIEELEVSVHVTYVTFQEWVTALENLVIVCTPLHTNFDLKYRDIHISQTVCLCYVCVANKV